MRTLVVVCLGVVPLLGLAQPHSTQRQCLQSVREQLDECLQELPPRVFTTGKASDSERAAMTTRMQAETACRRQAGQQRTACR